MSRKNTVSESRGASGVRRAGLSLTEACRWRVSAIRLRPLAHVWNEPLMAAHDPTRWPPARSPSNGYAFSGAAGEIESPMTKQPT